MEFSNFFSSSRLWYVQASTAIRRFLNLPYFSLYRKQNALPVITVKHLLYLKYVIPKWNGRIINGRSSRTGFAGSHARTLLFPFQALAVEEAIHLFR